MGEPYMVSDSSDDLTDDEALSFAKRVYFYAASRLDRLWMEAAAGQLPYVDAQNVLDLHAYLAAVAGNNDPPGPIRTARDALRALTELDAQVDAAMAAGQTTAFDPEAGGKA